MSFLSSMKKALGFSNELDEDEMLELTDDAAPADPRGTSVTRGTMGCGTIQTPVEHSVPQPKNDDALPGDIFDAIIKLFNEFQPEFVSSCLNTDQQKRYILEHIDSGVRHRLEEAVNQARTQATREASESQRKMTADLAHLKEVNASLEAKKNEFQSAQLSASRQKRALNERVHDLETQVANLEAEKEQYQLENRSLVNKLRVASVSSSSTDNEQLAQENIALKDRVNELEKQLEELQNSSQNIDTEATEEFKAIVQKVEQFEEVKQRLDAKIADLKSQLANANDAKSDIAKDLEMSKSENESLRRTIETNLYAQAQSEAELKAKIDELTEKLNQKPTAVAAEAPQTEYVAKQSKRKSKKRPVISAIDELMESTDWFVAQEPMPMKKGLDGEDDFGYKEPAKKPNSKDDDKQLSLF